MRGVLVVGGVLAIIAGCGGDSGGSGATGSSTGETATGSGDATAGTTFGEPDACDDTEACNEGTTGTTAFCVAPYDAGTQQRGASACVTECVTLSEVSRWCIDDDACCAGLRCSEVDGFCLPIDLPTTTSSSSGPLPGSSSSSSSSSSGSSTTAGT